MKKKVLFINPSLRQGGVEHSLITALCSLNPKKYDITLYVYSNMLDLLPNVPEYVNVVVGVDSTKYFRKPYCAVMMFFYYLFCLFGLSNKADTFQNKAYGYIHQKKVSFPHRKNFKNESFDTVISYSLHIGTEMGLCFPSNKYCVFLHSSDPDYHCETALRTFDKYDFIVCVSNGVKQVMSEAYPEYAEKMTVIENYVDAERIIELSNETNPINKENNYIIASCGRLSHEKGFDLAVEAAKILKENEIDFKWLFIGDGAERQKIEDLIKNYQLEKNIVITGFTDNPYSYIKCCDVFVQPSYEEAQPLTILEARILGKPIVSTKTVGGKYVLENGKKGVLTDFSGESLAEGIKSLTENPEKMHRFSDLYTIEDNQKEKKIYIEKLNDLLN